MFKYPLVFSILFVGALSGCSQPIQNQTSAGFVGNANSKTINRVTDPNVAIRTVVYQQKTHAVAMTGQYVSASQTGENVIDITNTRGISNYVYAHFPAKRIGNATITLPNGRRLTFWIGQVPSPAPQPTNIPSQAALKIPPNGVSMDPKITPLASVTAPVSAKRTAVIREAASKLGTPYIWGHNEDRGQYGFDCSNFTAYVYHHALGYILSGASQVQYHDVGTPIPVKDMKVGDLIIFDKGAHVGIYAGHHRMIEEGGGLGKVGYLSVAPSSFWGSRITVVKRVF